MFLANVQRDQQEFGGYEALRAAWRESGLEPPVVHRGPVVLSPFSKVHWTIFDSVEGSWTEVGSLPFEMGSDEAVDLHLNGAGVQGKHCALAQVKGRGIKDVARFAQDFFRNGLMGLVSGGRLEVIELGDVQDRTAGEILGEAVRIEAEADFNGVPAYKHHVVIRDVVMRAIGEANAKWLEGLGLQQLANLLGIYH